MTDDSDEIKTAEIDVTANVETAKAIAKTHPNGVKGAAAWLHAQCPGEFESPDHAQESLT
jgi:hypothetical protein